MASFLVYLWVRSEVSPNYRFRTFGIKFCETVSSVFRDPTRILHLKIREKAVRKNMRKPRRIRIDSETSVGINIFRRRVIKRHLSVNAFEVFTSRRSIVCLHDRVGESTVFA